MSLAAIAMFLASAALADLDAIDREVAAFTGAATGTAGGAMQPVDRRLRLKACSSPLSLSWREASRQTVVVECPDPGGWRLFVPVRSVSPAAFGLNAVNRGDSVTISVTGPGFAVSRPGEALEAGAAGAWIRVRPVDGTGRGGEPLRARIVRPGLVSLSLP
ncbi:MAG: flagella basal body P-ring formation protein FlgA [Novosphingobium sp.]|nr:flagella basal body P-ring formation protein FlgA [Novosphingobium sp.]